MHAVIVGKRVILFELEKPDLPNFIKLHREDIKGYLMRFCFKEMTEEEALNYIVLAVGMGQIIPFTVMTKEGKKSRVAGYVYVTDPSEYSCSIAGVMDKDFVLGLGRQIRKDKYTYSEDALVTLIDWIFKTFPKMQRIESDVAESNRLSLALDRKAGFTKEGVLRNYLRVDDRFENVVIHSIIRNEWEKKNNGLQKATININSAVQQTAAVVV